MRAHDALRAWLAEALRSLAELARSVETVAAVNAWQRISQRMEDVQTLIESSEFERGAMATLS